MGAPPVSSAPPPLPAPASSPPPGAPSADEASRALDEGWVESVSSETRRLGSKPQAHFELGVEVPSFEEISCPPPLDPTSPGREGAGPPPIDPVDPQAGAPPGHLYMQGDVIAGKYRLTRVIGRGGMGSVWLAHNIPLDIDVAIKLIRRDRTAPEAPGRLLQEARAAARLHHPSIVRVFDFGESEQGDPFIVMELLHGEPLSAILRRKRRLSAPVAVQTLLPVAGALASAHGKGIVHRDLKPDTILLSADEAGAIVPKVVDFGIAKLLSKDPDRQFTMAGEVLGSPDYMSPEQARGSEGVGADRHLGALGVLYEVIAGWRGLDGPNPCTAHRRDPHRRSGALHRSRRRRSGAVGDRREGPAQGHPGPVVDDARARRGARDLGGGAGSTTTRVARPSRRHGSAAPSACSRSTLTRSRELRPG
ncbi:MAG: serine/threonine-protein kinase [Byssovorax sp.]